MPALCSAVTVPSLSLCVRPSPPHHILDIPYQAHTISTAVMSLCLCPHYAHARPTSMPHAIPKPTSSYPCVIPMPTPCPSPCHLHLHACPMTMLCHPHAFVHPMPTSSLSLCHSHAHGTSFPIPMPNLCHAPVTSKPMLCPFCDNSIPMPSQSPHYTQTHIIPAPVPSHHPNSFAQPTLISMPIPTPSQAHAMPTRHLLPTPLPQLCHLLALATFLHVPVPTYLPLHPRPGE